MLQAHADRTCAATMRATPAQGARNTAVWFLPGLIRTVFDIYRGDTMAIAVTENAADQIRKQLAKRGKGAGLRVGVKKDGCSGFAYTFDYFDELQSGDRMFEAHGAKLAVDAEALAILDGSRLDFVRESGFKQVFKFDNPNVANTCGCGESFSVKPAKL